MERTNAGTYFGQAREIVIDREIDPDLLARLTDRGREQARVFRIPTAAGKRDVPRPGIAGLLGAADEEEIRPIRTGELAQNRSHRSARARVRDAVVAMVRGELLGDAIEAEPYPRATLAQDATPGSHTLESSARASQRRSVLPEGFHFGRREAFVQRDVVDRLVQLECAIARRRDQLVRVCADLREERIDLRIGDLSLAAGRPLKPRMKPSASPNAWSACGPLCGSAARALAELR